MVNTRRKGRKNELKARDFLLGLGYLVELTKNPSRFQKQQDLFGLWDLMAIRDDGILFIQVKSNRRVYGKELARYLNFPKPPGCSLQIWTYWDRKNEPEIITY